MKTLLISFAISSLICFGSHIHAQTQLSGIVNRYAKVIELDSCLNELVVDTIEGFSIGDTLLLVQMQGVPPDSSLQYDYLPPENSGRCELITISAINGNRIGLEEYLLFQYDTRYSVQVVSVIYAHGDCQIVDTVRPKPWNGDTGGIVYLVVDGSLKMVTDIDATGCGFRGGRRSLDTTVISYTGLHCSYESGYAGEKGESLTKTAIGFGAGRGFFLNGGGGGNGHNSGGGGGGNVGKGGQGGNQSSRYGLDNTNGLGGNISMQTSNLLRLAGGGGGGHSDNSFGTNGGSGGGIVIIKTKSILGNFQTIRSRGEDALDATNDGAGGGGGGGTVYLYTSSYDDVIRVDVSGGSGGNTIGSNNSGICYAPGGGGGGGWLIGGGDPTGRFNIVYNILGGNAGKVLNSNNLACNNTTYGAMDGEKQSAFTDEWNGTFPRGTQKFTKPSVLTDGVQICKDSSVQLFATGAIKYYWRPENKVSNTQDSTPIVRPDSTTNFVVEMTDRRGCVFIDTVKVEVYHPASAKIIGESIVCDSSIILYYTQEGRKDVTYQWSGKGFIDTSTFSDTLQVQWGANTSGYLILNTVVNATGCTDRDSLPIKVGSNSNLYLSLNNQFLYSSNCNAVEDTLIFTLFDSCNGRQAELLETSISGSSRFSVAGGAVPRTIVTDDTLRIIYTPDPNSALDESASLRMKLKLGWKVFDTVITITGRNITPRLDITLTPTLTTNNIIAGDAAECTVYSSERIENRGLNSVSFDLIYDDDLLEVASIISQNGISATYTNATVTNGIATLPLTLTGTDMTIDKNAPLVTVKFKTYLTDTTLSTIELSAIQLNNNDATYKNCTLSATGNSTTFTQASICGDSTIRNYLVTGNLPLFISSLHPNPTTGDVTVDFTSLLEREATLEVLDDLGRVVYEEKLSAKHGMNNHTIPIPKHWSGTFFLRLQMGKDVITGKFVKQ